MLLYAIGFALVAVHLRASYRTSVATLVATTFLIPGSLPFPNAPGNVLVVRVALWAAAVGLFLRANRGEVPASSIRPTRMSVALAVFVVIAYLCGVAFAQHPSRPDLAFDLWLTIFDQLVYVWVATAAVRTLGARRVARFAVGAVVVAALIALLERVTHISYARGFFGPDPGLTLGAQRLETRGGTVRVRAAADFSLQFAWVLAYFAPLVALFALRSKRRVMLLCPAAVAFAFISTVTRSAFAGLALGGVALLLSARGNRRVLVGLGAAGLVALVLYAGASGVRGPYQGADPESEKARERRLVLVTREMADQAWFGVGLDGLIQRGIPTTDSAMLGTYGATGVVGVVGLSAAIAAALATTAYGALRGDAERGPLAGATIGGLGAAVVGLFAFDTFSAPISSWNFWLLGVIGVGLYEEVRAGLGPVTPRVLRPVTDRLLLPVAGLVLGAAVFVAVPKHEAVEFQFFTLSPRYLSASKKPNDDYIGRILVDTVCDVGSKAVGPGVRVDCFDPLRLGPGTGFVRLETRSSGALRRAYFRFVGAARRVQTTKLVVTERPSPSRPTWARVAPGAGALIGAELALLLPAFRVRRRKA